MKIVYLRNFRNGLATNSSSTHSIIYKNEGEMLEDLNIFNLDYYDRCDETIAATREAKIKYILANIFSQDNLVRILSERYPEMKQYYPLVKERYAQYEERRKTNRYDFDDNSFGMTCRGALTFGNIDFDYEYLCHVIDNPDLVIIGGSDEEDFFYDKTDDHEELIDPYKFKIGYGKTNWDYNKKQRYEIFKNGNYWIGFSTTFLLHKEDYLERHNKCFGNRVRFSSHNEKLIPKYPELIDLKITNKCDQGCSFCFVDSTINKDSHARVQFIQSIARQLPNTTEFSMGGGNILLHPNLKEILQTLKNYEHINNVTINVKDCETILNNPFFKDIFEKLVDGIGVSVQKAEDIPTVVKFQEVFKNQYVVIHIIPELIGVEAITEIYTALHNHYIPILFLGYKSLGRGANIQPKRFTDEELEMFLNKGSISIDTLFAQTYYDYLNKKFALEKCVTLNEGEFSMYIDATNETFHKSSYHLESRLENCSFFKDRSVLFSLVDAFNKIRKSSGFEVYDETKYMYFNHPDKL